MIKTQTQPPHESVAVFFVPQEKRGIDISHYSKNEAVSMLAEMAALELGLSAATAANISAAAGLHDIGKEKISKSIIEKPGKLNAEEFEIIKTHTVMGAEMLSDMQGELGEMARVVCLYHHEWYDGSRSYWGTRAADLPEYVSIVSICDVYLALIEKRSYKEAWPRKTALRYIKNQSGTQFSPALVKAFIALMRKNSRVPA